MKTIRIAAAAIVAFAAAVAIHRFCVVPYQCNRIKASVRESTDAAYESRGTAEGGMLARRNLDRMQDCDACMPDDISADMIVAANEAVLGRNAAAEAVYRSALRFDRRPEIYLNLAAVELELGERDHAREHLVLACLFSPWYIAQIDDGLLRQSVVQRLIQLRPENAAFIRYVNGLNGSGT